jgi:hypothetical protein
VANHNETTKMHLEIKRMTAQMEQLRAQIKHIISQVVQQRQDLDALMPKPPEAAKTEPVP